MFVTQLHTYLVRLWRFCILNRADDDVPGLDELFSYTAGVEHIQIRQEPRDHHAVLLIDFYEPYDIINLLQ